MREDKNGSCDILVRLSESVIKLLFSQWQKDIRITQRMKPTFRPAPPGGQIPTGEAPPTMDTLEDRTMRLQEETRNGLEPKKHPVISPCSIEFAI